MEFTTTTDYSTNIATAVSELWDWGDYAEVYTDNVWGVYVVFAECGCDQQARVFVNDEHIHTATDDFPAYFITPQMAVTEALAKLVAAK